MALTTYAELQTAISTELDISEAAFVAAIPDLIKRCEAKLNRRLRLRNMETQAYAAYTAANTDRRVAMPTDFLEMLSLWIKPTTAADSEFRSLRQTPPEMLARYYDSSGYPTRFSLRNDIELNATVAADHRLQMHYIKRLNLAVDTTNWLLTNFPDAYLYGSLVEAEAFLRNDARIPVWLAGFNDAIKEANDLDHRSRNDAELSNTAAVLLGRGYRQYDILRDR